MSAIRAWALYSGAHARRRATLVVTLSAFTLALSSLGRNSDVHVEYVIVFALPLQIYLPDGGGDVLRR